MNIFWMLFIDRGKKCGKITFLKKCKDTCYNFLFANVSDINSKWKSKTIMFVQSILKTLLCIFLFCRKSCRKNRLKMLIFVSKINYPNVRKVNSYCKNAKIAFILKCKKRRTLSNQIILKSFGNLNYSHFIKKSFLILVFPFSN